MKTVKTLLKELRHELRYYQMCARIDAKALRRSRTRCMEIGAKMRELQALEKVVK
jgi:hypothetical protein